jgi:uncharacterized protein (DUF58 family)
MQFLKQNRIYIMPTKRGGMLLAVIVIMILTAATYSNNLIYLLAFFLFAIFFVSMIQTHYNLKDVELRLLSTSEVFEGEPLNILFSIEQKRSRNKQGLIIRSGDPRRWKSVFIEPENLRLDEPAKTVRAVIHAYRRGVHAVPRFYLETTYPMGLFRAWKVFRQEAKLLVYPKPVGKSDLQISNSDRGDHENGLRGSPEGDFGELKNYQTGESYHQIAWKHYARRRKLYTKVHWGGENRHYSIPWNPGAQDVEIYLQQMSAWIQMAMESEASFEMNLPGRSIESGAGFEHAQTCWRALAKLPPKAGST